MGGSAVRCGLGRIAALTGILLLALAVAGCTSTSSSPDESAVVGERAESFTKDFLEARVSDVSSYFADTFEMVTINEDGSTSSKTETKDAMQANYLEYKTQMDQAKAIAQTEGTPLTVSATLTKTISMSGTTATVAGNIKVTLTAGVESPSVEIAGASLTFTKMGDNWVITKWASPKVDLSVLFSSLIPPP